MQIREKGYYQWDGELKKDGIKWLPIFKNGIKSVYNKRFSKLLFAFSSGWFFIFLIAIYLSEMDEVKTAGNMLGGLIKKIIVSDAHLFHLFYTVGFFIFMLMILSLFAGADLISSDLKFKSYTLYLSRPITVLDYLKGKYFIVLFYLLLFSLIPGLLLLIAKAVFAKTISISLYVLFASIVFPIIVSLFFASMSLFFSSLSENGKTVKILLFSFYFFTDMLGGIFYGIFRNEDFFFLSVTKNIKQFGTFLFRTEENFYTTGFISGLIIIGLTIFFFMFMYSKMKRTEV